jgi:hypothetical protein
MADVDPRLIAAIRRQLANRPDAARIGWKVGRGDRERIGGGIVIGHLTEATLLDQNGTYDGGGAALHADAEVALHIGDSGAIAAYGAALEIVDLGGDGDAETIVANNVFHRAVAFGDPARGLPHDCRGALFVDGVLRADAAVRESFEQTLRVVARILSAVGERLRSGDRVITGSVVQVAVAGGDLVAADFGALGRVEVAIG